MLINLQTCTIPHFKGNFIITDLFLYHGWATVASGAARDENVSLLFFVTPSIKNVGILPLSSEALCTGYLDNPTNFPPLFLKSAQI